jgi:hypothetical protein
VAEKARYATAHRIRFRQITTPEMLQLSESPGDALSWKIGPSGPVGPTDIDCRQMSGVRSACTATPIRRKLPYSFASASCRS